MIKLLKLSVKGLKLAPDDVEIDFYAKQRVNPDKNEMLTSVFSNLYINNVISIVGRNASGKTTILKVISFVLKLLKNEPINKIGCKDILNNNIESEGAVFKVFFAHNSKVYKLETEIKTKLNNNYEKSHYISKEALYAKNHSSVRVKNDAFEFNDDHIISKRKEDEPFLLEDVSLIVAINKSFDIDLSVMDLISWTDNNGLRIKAEYFPALIRFLDPSIEYLKRSVPSDEQSDIILKFYGDKEISLHSANELSNYLSSGTIKGINVFVLALNILKRGGYLIIDELENHFNKEIVSTLINLFMDSSINDMGAVLVFSTHYVELLDIFERNDNVYFVRNNKGIRVNSLSDLVRRNDIKKSELFQSGSLEDSTPTYEAYINFKRSITKKGT